MTLTTIATQSPIQNAIETKIRPSLDLIQDEDDQQLSDMKSVGERMRTAIESCNSAMIELYSKPFCEHVRYAGKHAKASRAHRH